MARLINAFEQCFGSDGEPLSSGLLDFFESGSSTIRKTTYADAAETIANSNPVVLNGDGRAPNIFGSGTYNVMLRTSTGAQILARDPVGGDTGVSFGADWSVLQVYGISDVVRDDNAYWLSLVSGNTANQPSADSGGNWSEIDFTESGTIGSVLIMDGDVNPDPSSYIERNGASLSRAAYPALWNYAQTVSNTITQATKDADTLLYSGFYGDGDGTATFTIPDHRGLHYRILDDGRGVDSGRVIGSYQADENQEHTHTDVLVQSGSSIQISRGQIDPASLSGENRVKTVAVISLLRFR